MIATWLRRGWLSGSSSASLPVFGNGTYDSSIDALTGLPYRYCYLSGESGLPVVVLMHGFGGDYTALSDAVIQSVAEYGVLAVAVGMRGRSGRSGSPDCSGREIHDLYDALVAVRAALPGVAHADDAAIAGWSGGGGNALAAACKFPDTWLCVADHFGMSDYGRDGTYGWYNQPGGAGYQTTMDAWIGGSPAAVPDNYYARDATAAILNYSGGYMYMYHDTEDSAVSVLHSQRIDGILDGAGRTNYTYSESTPASSTRWLHGYPEPGTQIARAIPTWAAHIAARTTPTWTMAASGTVTVIGFMVTKRFTVWLGTGQSEVATVAYDVGADSYTVTPLTGSMAVSIVQGAKAASGTISGATTFTVV